MQTYTQICRNCAKSCAPFPEISVIVIAEITSIHFQERKSTNNSLASVAGTREELRRRPREEAREVAPGPHGVGLARPELKGEMTARDRTIRTFHIRVRSKFLESNENHEKPRILASNFKNFRNFQH